ncbi:DUF3141 domain-containing protein [Schauerella aestuarii]|uniref:DUF3141 domain-containing protein n=1 Tax=Schauerella aestuarii TaxID=2511204 RepID=UPI00136A461A|nr:DUF3141 domain-containing protein [Achromobacter aestuarii]
MTPSPTDVLTNSLPAAWTDAYAFMRDAVERSILYADVMRQRGNQYHEHMAQQAPNVLSMAYELVLDGRTLERPVNYGLLRIPPTDGVKVDPAKRPFLVVDPRAGHGPGIGGFKPESEIGVAVRAGHPCYFATFLPSPTPTQTVEDVMLAEARFLEEIIGLHPEAEGKPVVVGNCQAGWQIMMTAAMRPELFGPIIIAGAPLSYWAGWRGMNPMRYSGGLLGGSWLTAFASDLGAGTFDGAWLVQNFENLNPANTLWAKQYNLYANVDTEAKRYLSFEKWWGGHVFLNGPEIQYIVDNLFIGNRLSTGGLVTSDGIRIDLRNIRSPIIVFCSKGDNITPPPQALGWIPDLYEDDAQIRAHGQTIVYAVHESIGHLGIFVSGAVARKEHQEFTSNIDMIDVLPPGLYEAEIADKTPETLNADLIQGDYVLAFERRQLNDVRAIVANEPEDERRFAAVKRVSDINLGMYRSFMQPWLKATITPQIAETMQRLHPLRVSYEMFSDRNPWMKAFAGVADQIRDQREAVEPDNIFVQTRDALSNTLIGALDIWQQLRDDWHENTFMSVYGSPVVQDIAGLGAQNGPLRGRPGVSPEHHRFMAERTAELRALMTVGGVREAALRMLLYVCRAEGGIDERSFAVIRKLRLEKDHILSLQEFKDVIRDQALVMMLDGPAAIGAIPDLLADATPAEIRAALGDMKQVLSAAEPLGQAATEGLAEMTRVFERAAEKAASSSSKAARGTANGAAARGRRSAQANGKATSARGADATPALDDNQTSTPGASRPPAQLVLEPAESVTAPDTAGRAAGRTVTASATDDAAVADVKAAVAEEHGLTPSKMAAKAAGKSVGKSTGAGAVKTAVRTPRKGAVKKTVKTATASASRVTADNAVTKVVKKAAKVPAKKATKQAPEKAASVSLKTAAAKKAGAKNTAQTAPAKKATKKAAAKKAAKKTTAK